MKTYTLLFLLLALGIKAAAIPVVTTRFANPQYDCATQTYSLDVELQSNTENQQLYGMNVRFFYDKAVLAYQSIGNFVPGYGFNIQLPPMIKASSPQRGAGFFGFPVNHPFEFFNGAIQLTGSTSLNISTSSWTRFFTVYFKVVDPIALNSPLFCPSVIWDMEANPAKGGWQRGDDGVVITLVAAPPLYSAPATEHVVSLNWEYNADPNAMPYGSPVSSTCITTLPVAFNVTGTGSYCSNEAGKTVGLEGSQTGVLYTLNPGGIAVQGTGSAISFGLQPAGTYTVSAAYASTGCTQVMTGNAVINSMQPVPVSVAITASVNPVPVGESVTFKAVPVNGGSAPVFQWKVNGFNSGTNSAQFTYSPENGDIVTCILNSDLFCVSGNPAYSNSIVMEVQTVAINQTVTGTVGYGQINCYNATQILTIAGNGTQFVVYSGAAVTMIAGQKILYLPGTKVMPGGYMHGYITTNNQYCGQQAPALPSSVTGIAGSAKVDQNTAFTIYPNPTTENFTVEQLDKRTYNNVEVIVIGMHGEKLVSSKLLGEKKHEYSLTNLPYGLYFVKVIADGNVETFKLVKTK